MALAMTVVLPDICASLSSEDGVTSPTRYKDWCKANLTGREFSYLTPDDLYSLRCGVVHNGRFGELKHTVERVIFLPPGDGAFINGKINGAYIYSIDAFCGLFTKAVHKWFESNRDDEIVCKNMPRLMQYRQGGMPPYLTCRMALA